MGRSGKKERERRILDMVYGSCRPFLIENSERPDFLLRLAPVDGLFGVEIAESYHSESQARLERLPGYLDHLLDGGTVKHKNDRQGFAVDRITIATATGKVTAADLPAIVEQVPTLAQCAGLVADLIVVKDTILTPAFASLRHVNLLVCDRTHLLHGLDPKSFYRLYCCSRLRDAVLKSRFREVYFVTRFATGDAFVPLKMLVTLARLYLFNGVERTTEKCDNSGAVEDFMRRFAAHLAAISTGSVGLRRDATGTEVLYGDTGFLVGSDLGVCVRRYRDHSFPEVELIARPSMAELDTTLLEQMAQFELENVFVTQIAFPVEKQAQTETA